MPSSECIRRPIEYFRDFLSDDILEYTVRQSNLYACQRDPSKPLTLSIDELEQFVGVVFAMSLVRLSSTRLYWSSQMQCPLICETMTRERWEEIKTNLHFNDNYTLPGENNFAQQDKLFKVRPFLDHLKQKFRQIRMPQSLCVDEQMVPFKGHSSLKQYIPSKPHKWGYKVFSLCDIHGIMYDFEVYDSHIKPAANEPDLGASSNIVLRLAECIPRDMNHLLFFDNWFTSIPLIINLESKRIHALGTVLQCRLPGITFPSDKALLKSGRGSHVELEANIDDVSVRAVKWADNRCVSLVSSFASAHPMATVTRYDKKTKEHVVVPCPYIVKIYNQCMGGVDLMDSVIALHRIAIRSKKYYHRLVFHFLDVTLVNSWFLYRRDATQVGVVERKQMTLEEFKMSVIKSLLLEGKKRGKNKRGRPSSSVHELHIKKKRRGPATKGIPGTEIRTDGIDHFPKVADKGGRCKNPGCNGVTVISCGKCAVNLCLTKNRNCYEEFHSN